MGQDSAAGSEKCKNAVDIDKAYECSSMKSCYDFDKFMYSNDKCANSAESCAKWTGLNGKLVEGCLRDEYCGTRGRYAGKGEILFLCPDDTDKRGESP